MGQVLSRANIEVLYELEIAIQFKVSKTMQGNLDNSHSRSSNETQFSHKENSNPIEKQKLQLTSQAALSPSSATYPYHQKETPNSAS